MTAMARVQGISLAFMSALFIFVIQGAGGAIFEMQNNCGFTVWAAGSQGGGQRLDSGQSWSLQVDNGTGSFWGRTGCYFNGNASGSCKTGDCGGLLNCQGSTNALATLVEYSLNQDQKSNFYDISVVNGFNLPISIIPSNSSCPSIACNINITGICPSTDGCDSACSSFNTSQNCCTAGYSKYCSPTNYTRIFQRQCPQAVSAPTDGNIFGCPTFTDYQVVFCGGNATSFQGKNITVVSPNSTLTLNVSTTIPPRSTNSSHPLTPLPGNSTHLSGKKTSKKMVLLLGSVVGLTAIFLMLCLVFGRCGRQRKTYVRTDKNIDARGNFGEVYFDYKILRNATGNFDRNNMLGKGGFGEVYKGRLPDGRDVAVKKLKGKHTTQPAEEFLTEVKLISSVRHRNLVRLLGCCKRKHKRLLVYEFMSNNSLDKHLFGERRNPLRWENRLNIIVGTARGLAYLHGECNVRIIHRDIKCANILLDDSLHPKIADFGLARFFPETQTHLSTRVGGTIGYTAPEYAVHGQLTEKADIYSYGIVVLEIVSGRKCVDARLPAHRQLLLEWAWNQFEQNEVWDIVDPLLEGQYPREQALRVVTIALLCTQGSWMQRPAMSKVVSMLTDDSERTVEPTRPAFIDAATDSPANFTSMRESATQAAAPTPTSHGSITVSLLPR